MMANENMQEWGTSAEVEQETIRAVVQAYADGKIELEKPKTGFGSSGGLRNAPNFCKIDRKVFKDVKNLAYPYNAESIAWFLGWMSGDQVSPRVRNALSALEAMEDDLIKGEQLCGLTPSQAKAPKPQDHIRRG